MIPLKLKLINFLSYRNSEIDFTKLAPVTLIVGEIEGNKGKSNGCGKSSLFDAISFALFGECRVTGTRNVTLDDLICWGENEASVEFVFSIDGTEYSITRSRSKTRRATKVDFSEWTGGKWNSVGDRKKDTQSEIIKRIGLDYTVFSNSVFFKQGEVSAFAEMTSGERRDVVKKLLEVEKYQACSELAKVKYDELVRTTSSEQIFLNENDGLENNLVEVQKQIESLTTQIESYEENRAISERKIKKLQNELFKNKERVTLKHKLEEEIEGLEVRVGEIEESITTSETNQKEYQNNIDEAQKQIDKLTEEFNALVKKTPDRQLLKQQMENTRQEYTRTESELDAVRTKKIGFETDIGNIKNSIKNLRDLGVGQCPTCFADVTTKSKTDIEKHLKEEYGKIKPKYEEAVALFDQWTTRLSEVNIEIEKIKGEANEYNLTLQKKKLVKEKIESQTKTGVQNKVNIEKEETSIVKQKEQLERDSVQLETKRKQYGELKDVDISSHQEIQTKIGKEQESIEQINELVGKLNIQKGSFLGQQKDLEGREKEVQRIKTKLQHVQDEMQIYLELSKVFGKNGIQALILENSAVEIEKIANELLKDFTEGTMSISINTLRKNKTDDSMQEVFDIEIRDGIRIGLFETFSGGEKFKVAFAIRIALSLLLMRKSGVKVPFILYDEAFSDLDNDSTEKLVDIFFILRKYFELQLIITHTTQLKDKFEDILLIQKDSKGSRVIY